MDNNIGGSINEFGVRVTKKTSNEDFILKPKCDTIKYVILFANWLILFLIIILLTAVLRSWTNGLIIFLTITLFVLNTYLVLIHNQWFKMSTCKSEYIQ